MYSLFYLCTFILSLGVIETNTWGMYLQNYVNLLIHVTILLSNSDFYEIIF